MTATLTHRRAMMPTPVAATSDAVSAIARAIGIDLAPWQRSLIDRAYAPLSGLDDPRLVETRIRASTALGSVVASLPEIRADVSAELRDELDQVEVETHLMTWAALAPDVTWHDVAAVASVGLAHLGLVDDAGRARLLAGVLALLRGWLIRTTGKVDTL